MTDDAMMGVKGKRLWPYFLALEKWSHWWQSGPKNPSEKMVCPGIGTPPANPVQEVPDVPVSFPISSQLC